MKVQIWAFSLFDVKIIQTIFSHRMLIIKIATTYEWL